MNNVKWIYPKELQNLEKFIGYPNKHLYSTHYTIDKSYLSDIVNIFQTENCLPEFNYSLKDLLDINILNNSCLIIILPNANVPTDLLSSSIALNNWLELLDLSVKLLKLRPNSRLVLGCDWDEFNMNSFIQPNKNKKTNFISLILDTFRKYDVKTNRLTWLYCNSLVPEWIQKNLLPNESQPQSIYHSNYLYRLRWLKNDFVPDINYTNQKTKWFLCLNRRPSDHRIILSYYFYKNVIRPSNISCRIDSGSEICKIDKNASEHLYLESLKFLNENINREYWESFINSLPWSIDYHENKELGFDDNNQDSLHKNLVHESACYIVTETWFNDIHNNYIGWFTEKTLKSFLYGLPTIYVAPQYTIRNVKKLGFKTYNHMIDESYDDEPDAIKRFNLVCKEIEKIQNVEHIQNWYQSGLDIANYNKTKLKELWERSISKEILDFHFTN